MPRKRIYADAADKQAAYRRRSDLSLDLLQLRADLVRLARDGRTVTIDPIAIDFTDRNTRDVIRQLAAQIHRLV